MTEENIKVMISVAYRSGWKDGMNGKDLPTLGELDKIVDEMYENATIKAKLLETEPAELED